MNEELKQKWVEALRSGKYKQGKQALRNKADCYCCLGVLCELSGLGKWQDNELIDLDHFLYQMPSDDYGISVLAEELQDVLDISCVGDFHISPTTREMLAEKFTADQMDDLSNYTDLAALNYHGWSFADIATLIEHVEFLPNTIDEDDDDEE
jgi:hypothetical protein